MDELISAFIIHHSVSFLCLIILDFWPLFMNDVIPPPDMERWQELLQFAGGWQFAGCWWWDGARVGAVTAVCRSARHQR